MGVPGLVLHDLPLLLGADDTEPDPLHFALRLTGHIEC